MSPLAPIALALGPVQFDRPVFLALFLLLALLTIVIARRSLAGLAGATRRSALALRLLVLALLVACLAQPSLRRTAHDVAVLAVVDASRSVPPDQQQRIDDYIARAADRKRPADRLGTVTAARSAAVQALPSPLHTRVERTSVGPTDSTNLAEAVTLAAAAAPQDAAARILLATDGNETAGSLLRAAEAARALNIPIDVLPVDYRYDDEVLLEQLVSPAAVRAGETISLRVVLTATRPVRGRLLITESGLPIDLDPSSPSDAVSVILEPGKNAFTVPITPTRPGPQSFEAVFEPVESLAAAATTRTGDAIAENNRARSVTFVGSEGSVLLLRETTDESAALEAALAASRIRVDAITSAQLPTSLTELAGYDCLVLVNQPAYNFTDAQQLMLRQFIHDAGGGLVMVGGPDAFGAGGWIGSPLADALPIRLDPPQKRQMPRGALALVLDASGSMASNVAGASQQYFANEAAVAAVEALSSLDLVTVIAFDSSTQVITPLSPVADGSGLARRIRSISPGGGTNMFPAIEEAGRQLTTARAGIKHIIVLSDGQTMGDPNTGVRLVTLLQADGITTSTVAIGDGADTALLAELARRGAGNTYNLNSAQAFATLPQIFVKEAQTIRRSLIWEGDPFTPALVAASAEPMRGIRALPPISGYIVAADREGLSLVTMRGQENDPVGALWQYGLGKVVTITTDATSRWAADWLAWDGYKQFWEQHVRWASRPGGSASLRLTTENRGDATLVAVDALDTSGNPLDFARFNARLAKPDGSADPVDLRQVGPGRYEALVPTADAGSYLLSMQYRAPGAEGQVLEGSAQAAITRPFADEFRALASNRALLRQVAQITGGRELSGDPAADNLWDRAGLTMPVATRPVWLLALLIAIGLFLLDVAVRRVRIDPAAIARALRRGATRAEAAATTQTGSLQAAREKARAKLAPQPDRPARAPAPQPLNPDAPPTAILSIVRPTTDGPAAPAKDTPADSLSALKRAKRRAQDEFDPNA